MAPWHCSRTIGEGQKTSTPWSKTKKHTHTCSWRSKPSQSLKRPGNFSLSQTFQLTNCSAFQGPKTSHPRLGAKGCDQRTQISWLEPFAPTAISNTVCFAATLQLAVENHELRTHQFVTLTVTLRCVGAKVSYGQCAPQTLQTPGPKTLVTRNYGLLHTVAGFVHAIRDSPRIVTRHTGHRWHNTSTICMDMNRSGQWEAQSDQCPNKFGTKKTCSFIPCDDLRNMFVAKY